MLIICSSYAQARNFHSTIIIKKGQSIGDGIKKAPSGTKKPVRLVIDPETYEEDLSFTNKNILFESAGKGVVRIIGLSNIDSAKFATKGLYFHNIDPNEEVINGNNCDLRFESTVIDSSSGIGLIAKSCSLSGNNLMVKVTKNTLPSIGVVLDNPVSIGTNLSGITFANTIIPFALRNTAENVFLSKTDNIFINSGDEVDDKTHKWKQYPQPGFFDVFKMFHPNDIEPAVGFNTVEFKNKDMSIIVEHLPDSASLNEFNNDSFDIINFITIKEIDGADTVSSIKGYVFKEVNKETIILGFCNAIFTIMSQWDNDNGKKTIDLMLSRFEGFPFGDQSSTTTPTSTPEPTPEETPTPDLTPEETATPTPDPAEDTPAPTPTTTPTATPEPNITATATPESTPTLTTFSAAPIEGAAPLTVGFRDISTTEAVERVWDFGDGTISSTNSPKISHEYKKPGTFTVSLTVNGEMVTRENLVTVTR